MIATTERKKTKHSDPRINRINVSDAPVHNWYRFVLSYPPHIVREYLERFNCDSSSTVLDPFCGTGTTVVECKKLGIPSIGIEANPLAHFAASTKLDWDVNSDLLLTAARELAVRAGERLSAQGIEDEFYQPYNESVRLRSLDPDREKLILKNSISPLPLHKSLELLDEINRYRKKSIWNHLRLAFAKALISSIGNLKFGPEVGVGKLKEDAPVISPWFTEVQHMADDLVEVHEKVTVPSVIYLADARYIPDSIKPASVDCVITSPPYPNEKDYSRTTRLESVLLGFISSRDDLRLIKRNLMRSNTRGVYKEDDDDIWIATHSGIQEIAEEIEHRRIELGKTSGFERMYARVAKLYFGGMAKHFEQLKPILKPGAKLAYVVGDQASYLRVMIRTGELLSEVAEKLGYEVLGIDLFRTRLSTTTGEQLREEVVLLKWPEKIKK